MISAPVVPPQPPGLEPWFIVAGLALQLLGVVLTAQGYFVVTSASTLFDTDITRARKTLTRVIRYLASPVGHRAPTVVHTKPGQITINAGTPFLSTAWLPLYSDRDMTDRDAIQELERRVAEAYAYTQRQAERTSEEARATAKQIEDIIRNIDQKMETVESRSRRGLRKEAFGLAVLTGGSILQAIGGLLG